MEEEEMIFSDSIQEMTGSFKQTSIESSTVASHDEPSTEVGSAFDSGFDADHPRPTYEQLKNAGFSNHLAQRISSGEAHSYSDKELYQVIYESDDPVQAYNEMMDIKAHAAIARADELIEDIKNSGLVGQPSGTSHYNNQQTSNSNNYEVGSADCRSECKYTTGESYNYANWGYSH